MSRVVYESSFDLPTKHRCVCVSRSAHAYQHLEMFKHTDRLIDYSAKQLAVKATNMNRLGEGLIERKRKWCTSCVKFNTWLHQPLKFKDMKKNVIFWCKVCLKRLMDLPVWLMSRIHFTAFQVKSILKVASRWYNFTYMYRYVCCMWCICFWKAINSTHFPKYDHTSEYIFVPF